MGVWLIHKHRGTEITGITEITEVAETQKHRNTEITEIAETQRHGGNGVVFNFMRAATN